MTADMAPDSTPDVLVDDMGEGNWELTTVNGVWVVTADHGEPALAGGFHIDGPNHHMPEMWADSFPEVLELVRVFGVDGRSARADRRALMERYEETTPGE